MKFSPQNLFIPTLVSFSLTGLGVVILYYLSKKHDDDEMKKKKRPSTSKDVKIPRQFVPIIIGRGGSTLREIELSTGTTIRFAKEDNSFDGKDLTCIVTGKIENIESAEKRIQDIIQNRPIIETYETEVPQRTINKLLEKGEEALKHIQQISNAKIILSSSVRTYDLDSKKRVVIKGTAEQIADALIQIENKVIEEKKEFAKIEASLKDRAPRIKTPDFSNYITDFEKTLDKPEEPISKDNEGSIEVYVSYVENPNIFYIQFIGDGSIQLTKLVDEMTEYYSNVQNREIHSLKKIFEGQIVAAKFSFDEQWYRAEILSCLDDDEYTVFFIDYGDVENVNSKNILELKTEFLSLRVQAVECTLAGVKHCGEEWSLESIDLFSNLTQVAQWHKRIAKIRGYKERGNSKREGSPIPCIELYDPRDNELINIGQELIKHGLAVPEDAPIINAKSNFTLPSSNKKQIKKNTKLPIEEINLIDSPSPKKPIIEIDLVTPEKSNTKTFIDRERNNSRNGNLGNKNYRERTNDMKSQSRKPFQIQSKQRVQKTYNILPAGAESDDEFDDEMEFF